VTHISVTSDTWKSDANDSYVTFTGHGLDSEFNVVRLCLDVLQANESHTSEKIEQLLTVIIM
jgi:hypothetical protein